MIPGSSICQDPTHSTGRFKSQNSHRLATPKNPTKFARVEVRGEPGCRHQVAQCSHRSRSALEFPGRPTCPPTAGTAVSKRDGPASKRPTAGSPCTCRDTCAAATSFLRHIASLHVHDLCFESRISGQCGTRQRSPVQFLINCSLPNCEVMTLFGHPLHGRIPNCGR
jgi:hypothetical protein